MTDNSTPCYQLKKTLYLYAVYIEHNPTYYTFETSTSDMSYYPDWVYLDSQEVVFGEPDSGYVEKMINQRIEENRIKELDDARKLLAKLEGSDNG